MNAPRLPADLAVILVTWNVRDLALAALRTLYADLATSGLEAGVWVVDNQSADGTAGAIRAQYPQATVIEAGANLGFAAGNNVALRALGFTDRPALAPGAPRAVFLLNPDTLTEPGAIHAMHDALFRLPGAGVVGARLSYEDGTLQHSAFRFPGLLQLILDLYPVPRRMYGRLYETRWNGRYPRRLYAGRDPFEVDHTLGATMMLRREVIEQTGLFDEQFFMYCEEVDWSLRICKVGWRIYTIPTAHIYHLEGRSSSQIKPRSLLNLWTSRLKLYRKHYPRWKFLTARWLVQVGIRLRLRALAHDASTPPDQRRDLAEAYNKVIKIAADR
jgi:hypothetical protein